MKHLKKFENFKPTNEWFGQEFITGHETGEKELAEQRIENEINAAIQEYHEHPEDFMEYDEEELREELLEEAEENGFRGTVEVRQSANDPKAVHANKFFIVYYPKSTSLQDMGSAAAGQLRK